MEDRKEIIAGDLDTLWMQLEPDFASGTGLHDYHVALRVHSHVINLDIVSSPGGGFEGGYGNTYIKTNIKSNPGFVFVLQPEDFLNRIGKLFGLEDVILGFKEFDHDVLIKTNNAGRLQTIFSDESIRTELQNQSGYSFKLENEDDTLNFNLELDIQRAITDLSELQPLIEMYYKVLVAIDPVA